MLNTVKVRLGPRKRQSSSEFILYKLANDVSIMIQFTSHLGPKTSPVVRTTARDVFANIYVHKYYLSNVIVLAFQ